MNKHSVFKVFAGLGAGLLLLGAAAAPQAAITITKADGSICTDGTINVNGTVTPVDASCHAPGVTTYTLTVSKDGSGTVTGTGFDCGNDCDQSYPANTAPNVTLTATPAPGFTFSGWSGAGCSGTGTCIVNQPITSDLTVTATFIAAAPSPGACPDLPANTTVVDTGSMNASWRQQTFLPLPPQIYAFKVTVPGDWDGRGNFQLAGTASTAASKRLVVSTCPGALTPVGEQAYCSVGGTETTTVRLSTRSADPSYYCKLAPGTYYVNVFSKNKLTDSGYNCTTTTNCSFYASRSAPY